MRLRIWGEPEGGWAMFPFPGKKKEKQPFPIELKIELSVGQVCGLEGEGGGKMLLPGAEELWQAWPWRWWRVGAWGQEAVLAQGCWHQLTCPVTETPTGKYVWPNV